MTWMGRLLVCLLSLRTEAIHSVYRPLILWILCFSNCTMRIWMSKRLARSKPAQHRSRCWHFCCSCSLSAVGTPPWKSHFCTRVWHRTRWKCGWQKSCLEGPQVVSENIRPSQRHTLIPSLGTGKPCWEPRLYFLASGCFSEMGGTSPTVSALGTLWANGTLSQPPQPARWCESTAS